MGAQEIFQGYVDKFNAKVDADPSLKDELASYDLKVYMVITDENTYRMHLKDSAIGDFGMGPGDYSEPDIQISMDMATLEGINNGSVNPMMAYMNKKLVLEKGSLGDVMVIGKLFQ